jgi:3-phenylpropionate/cinnamic acid dioxygenase small subunit
MQDRLAQLVQLNADYAAAIDDDRLEAWPDFFVPDCLYKITSADNLRDGNEAGIVYADSRAMLADRILALRRANIYERQTYRHIVGLPRFVDTEQIETPFLVVRTMRDGRMDLFAAGGYVDRLDDASGQLLFRERIVVCDSARFDTLVAIPL